MDYFLMKKERLISIIDNKDLLPIWNYKTPSEKDYKEIILFLLDELEWHHSGIKDFYLRGIKSKYNIDF